MKAFVASDRVFTLIDQALYTGTNFGLVVLVAIIAGLPSLGHVALIVSISALLHSLFVGVVLEPLTVFGSRTDAGRLRDIYGFVAALVSLVFLILAMLLLALGTYTDSPYVADAGMGFLIFCAQSIVLYNRRQFLVQSEVRSSVGVSLRYCISASALCLILIGMGRYNEYFLTVVIFLAGVVASGKWWRLAIAKRCTMAEIGNVFTSVRKYTSWTVVSSLPAALSVHGIYWIAEYSADRDTVGLLKLCEQLVTPLLQIIMTMSILDQIESARDFKSRRIEFIKSRMGKRTISYLLMAIIYVSLLTGVMWVIDVLELGVTNEILFVFPLYGLVTLLYAYSIPRNVVAKSCRRPDIVALAYGCMSLALFAAAAWISPVELSEFIVVLIIGWLANAAILEKSVFVVVNPNKRVA